ncbi:MAG: SH3 domain-containing protein [Sulfurovaceae bacterium]|nr:SH3 domain-containing protein [Sulfurovaceae bacterium]
MKKVIMGLLMVTLFLMADETNKSIEPFACTPLELLDYGDSDRYVYTGSISYGFFYYDKKTIQIDRVNKRVKVWMVMLSTLDGRQYMIESLGKFGDLSNFGYNTQLLIIDYANMKSKITTAIMSNCNGSIIAKVNLPSQFSYMYSNSIERELAEIIIKKYKLNLNKTSLTSIVYGLDPNRDGFLSIRNVIPKNGNSREIGRLYNGDAVKIVEKQGHWYKIKLKDSDGYGWCHENWIKLK